MLQRRRREKEHLQCRQWPAQGTKVRDSFLIAYKEKNFLSVQVISERRIMLPPLSSGVRRVEDR